MIASITRKAFGVAGITLIGTLLPFSAAQAYIGPGIGAGAVAVVLGVIGSVFLALFAIVWYPLKRLLRKFRPADAAGGDGKA